MANVVPTQWFAGYSVASGNIQIPLATLNLTAAEASASAGDARLVLLRLIETAHAANQSLAPAARPIRLNIAKTQATLPSANTITDGFAITASRAINPADLALASE